MPIGVYIHVPFCRQKCPYCDFYSLPFQEALADRYTAAVVRAVRSHPFGGLRADTLYFGGGTPVLLGPRRLGEILAACRDAFGLAGAEITLEANPAESTPADLRELYALGFRRISFGVQSMQPQELALLGRTHSPSEARRAVLDAADAGFLDIACDLMLALPGQTQQALAASLAELAALPVRHLSAYLLKVEPGTPFAARYQAEDAQKNSPSLMGEDRQAQCYLDCVQLMGQHGFKQYEISNFAREGAVSRHNLKYWRGEQYLGIGPAAHSFLQGKRFYFPPDLAAFAAASDPFSLIVDDGAGGGLEEELLLRLRLCEGYDLAQAPLNRQQTTQLLLKARQLQRGGLCRVQGRRIALTPAGFLLSNSVIAALLAVL